MHMPDSLVAAPGDFVHRNHHLRVVVPDGKQVASIGRDGILKVSDAETGLEVRTLRGHTESVNCVAFGPEGKRIASGSADNSIGLWDTETGTRVMTLEGHRSSVHCVAFSPIGRRIALVSWKWIW